MSMRFWGLETVLASEIPGPRGRTCKRGHKLAFLPRKGDVRGTMVKPQKTE